MSCELWLPLLHSITSCQHFHDRHSILFICGAYLYLATIIFFMGSKNNNSTTKVKGSFIPSLGFVTLPVLNFLRQFHLHKNEKNHEHSPSV